MKQKQIPLPLKIHASRPKAPAIIAEHWFKIIYKRLASAKKRG